MSDAEVEGKLIIVSERPEEVAARIAALDRIDGFLLKDRRIHQIRDVYFDTPGRDLVARKVALRIRDEDGLQKLTVKGEAETLRDVHSRPELELDWSPAAFEQIADVLHKAGVPLRMPQVTPGLKAEDALRGAGLRPSTARTNRRTGLSVTREGLADRVAELVIDDVTFLAGDLEVRHFEVECEAKGAGNSEGVQRVLDELRLSFPELEPFEYSKLDIAEALNRLAETGRLQPLLADGVLKPSAYDTIRRVLQESGSMR